MKNGFSLVELLVVISIIAILSAAGIVVYQSVQPKTRDSIRKSDLNNLALALEAYFQKNGNYIDGTAGTEGNCASDTTSFYSGIATYMTDNQVPKDPKTQANYCYVAVGSGSSQGFRLFTILENLSDANNITGCPGGYNYAVVSDNLAPACPLP